MEDQINELLQQRIKLQMGELLWQVAVQSASKEVMAADNAAKDARIKELEAKLSAASAPADAH